MFPVPFALFLAQRQESAPASSTNKPAVKAALHPSPRTRANAILGANATVLAHKNPARRDTHTTRHWLTTGPYRLAPPVSESWHLRRPSREHNIVGGRGKSLPRHFHGMFHPSKYSLFIANGPARLQTKREACAALGA